MAAGTSGGKGVWRRNYSSIAEWSEECKKIMDDQAEREQVLKMSETDARRRFPGLTVASLGAQKKEKPGGAVTARILFGGTHGIDVNTRIRIRDQERAPIAADVKRFLREKSTHGTPTFALSADISEAHRQVHIDRRDWHYLGCLRTHSRDIRNCISFILLVKSIHGGGASCAVLGRTQSSDLAPPRRR